MSDEKVICEKANTCPEVGKGPHCIPHDEKFDCAYLECCYSHLVCKCVPVTGEEKGK